jgi:hypothetical protein
MRKPNTKKCRDNSIPDTSSDAQASEPQVGRESLKGRVLLEIGNGEPDLEALSALAREWIVPVLVKEFLAERAKDVSRFEANQQKRTNERPGRSMWTVPHEFCQ